jgi:hypothetical protein
MCNRQMTMDAIFMSSDKKQLRQVTSAMFLGYVKTV